MSTLAETTSTNEKLEINLNESAEVETQVAFGDLTLAFTNDFEFRWNDKKSGGKYDGEYYQPIPPKGFHALGSIGLGNYSDPSKQTAALCVKETVAGNGALKAPTKYERIWQDKGSGAEHNGSCWRPIPPEGYVALGDVFNNGHSTAPSLSDIMCVRKDLVQTGVVGDMIWTDKDTHSDKDFGSWEIAAADGYVDPTLGLIAANTFIGVESHSKPATGDVVNVLKLPLPSEAFGEPQPPVLTSRNPPSSTAKVVDHVVTVPFTAVNDPDKDVQWKVANSPFYKVVRLANYALIIFDSNDTSNNQTKSKDVSVGVSKSQTDTFSKSVGVSVTAEKGVSFLGTGGKVSATVSVELGWEQSTSIEEFKSVTVKQTLVTAPQSSAALWATNYTLVVVRADDSNYADPLVFEEEIFYQSEYPAQPQ